MMMMRVFLQLFTGVYTGKKPHRTTTLSCLAYKQQLRLLKYVGPS